MLKTTIPSAAVLLIVLSGCHRQDQPKVGKPEAPAKVEKHPQETEISRITLTARAVERLGITTIAVEQQTLQRRRTFGGEVVVPPGRSIIVTAPFAGTLVDPDSNATPLPGVTVAAGREIFSIVPLLTPERYIPTPAERVQMANAHASLAESQINADGDVKRSTVQVQAETINVARARRLWQDKAGSQRDVDNAIAQLALAEKTLEAATARKTVLDGLLLDTKATAVSTMPIRAPLSGVVRGISASVGQVVVAGTPLFELVNLDAVWIRVPIYVGFVEEVVMGEPAMIGQLAGGNAAKTQSARPVEAPPTADPLASTADLYFELANPDGSLLPGQRVGATLAMREEKSSPVIPWAAVLHDMHGGTWVYEQVAENVYQRQRIRVDYIVDDVAVLVGDLQVGTVVVVDGTAELFGTEFGSGK